MSEKNNDGGETISDMFKTHASRHSLSKFEYDLYHEEDDIAQKAYRVKRISLPNKGEKWKIFENTKVIFVLEGTKLSKKEREFLRTLDGVNFMLQQAKLGIASFNKFKQELKLFLNNPA